MLADRQIYTTLPLTQLTEQLPTACLAFGHKAGETVLTTATAALSQATGAAGKRAKSPIGFIYGTSRHGWYSGWEGCLAVLMLVAVAFVAL